MNDATKPLAPVERPSGPLGRGVGRFVVLSSLGEGGSGEVFAAFDPVLDRRVAIKILHATGASGPAVVREGRMLARLSHPGVVAVHDVGLHEDRAFLAMELVIGGDLWAWSRRREPRAILRALVHAGHGIAAAHAAGIVHGDIKPANLLVGDDGLARVSDFGIARTHSAADIAGGLHVGAGTPAYMAPEQHAGQPAGPCSDQYAFCLSAWVALTGEHPYASTGGSSDDEVTSATARDSARAGDRGSGCEPSADAFARAQREWRPRWPGRRAVPARIARAIERGLALDPADRFASMDALLTELELATSRGRRLVLAGSVVLVAAAASVLATAALNDAPEGPCLGAEAHMAEVWNPERRAALARSFSEAAVFGAATWDGIAPAIDTHADTWVRMHTAACEATAVRAEQSTEVLDLRMGCLRRARSELDASLSTLEVADLGTVQNAHHVIDGLDPIERCADVDALAAAVPPADPGAAARVENGRERLDHAQSLLFAGKIAESETIVQDLVRETADLDHPAFAAEIDFLRGSVHQAAGRYAEAEAALRAALSGALRHDHWEVATRAAVDLASVVGHIEDRHAEGLAYGQTALDLAERSNAAPGLDASAVDVLGMIEQRKGDAEAAEARYREAIARLGAVGDGDPRVHTYRVNLAGALRSQGRFDEAETELFAALAAQVARLGDGHPDVALSRLGLARLYMQSGRLDLADAELAACLSVRESALGEDHPDIGRTLLAVGDLRAEQGRRADAELLLRRALGNLAAALGPDHADVGVAHNSLAIVLEASGRHVEAEAEIRRALAIQRAALGAGHPQLAAVHDTLGAILLGQDRLDEAEAEQRIALAMRRETLGEAHPAVATSHHNLGALLLRRGDAEAAATEFRAALAACESTFGPESPLAGSELHGLGAALARLERHAEAKDVLERAWAIRDTHETPPEVRGTTAWFLARELWAVGERSRARTLAAIAEEAYRAAEGERWAPQIEAIAAWRSEH